MALFNFKPRFEKETYFNPNIGEPIMKSLKEGVEICIWDQENYLGGHYLDMGCPYFFGGAVALLPFMMPKIIPKSWTRGIWNFKSCPGPVGALVIMFTSAYFSFKINVAWPKNF